MDTKLSDLTTIPAVDRSTDLLYIADDSGGSSNKVTPNTLLGITGDPVGTSDTQTLTAKTLTAPAISSPVLSGTITGTYTLGGTPTFPSSVATLTGTQTLTNKTLTSPTINTATISNPTLTIDTISEHTSTNGVTVDGLNIKDGKLVTSNSVVTVNVTDKAVTGQKLGTPVAFSAYNNSTQNNPASAETIQIDTENYDLGSNFNTSTYTFTAPYDGVYHFNGCVTVQADDARLRIYLYHEGVNVAASSETTKRRSNVVKDLELASGDEVNVRVDVGTGSSDLATGNQNTYFTGHLIGRTD